MLRVLVEINGGVSGRRTLAEARIANVSDLADVSDYAVHVREGENPLAKTLPWDAEIAIEDHDRYQSVWALVSRVAEAATERAKEAPIRSG